MKKLFFVLSLLLFITSRGIVYAAENDHKTTNNFTPAQIKELEKITHDFLLNNPKILIEMGKKLQKEEQKEQKNKIMAGAKKHKSRLFDSKAPGRLVLGNPEGKIILVEFTQHQCHHCKDATVVANNLLKNHPELKFIVIYWPFFGEDAVYTAKAVLASQKQNKAKELNEAMFAYKDPVTKDKADAVIKSVAGLNAKKLYADMAAMDKELDEALKENFNLAQDLNIVGTPALFLANKELTKISLPSEQKDLEKALNEIK